MAIYFLQFSTDFHLLAALATIDDISRAKINLIGPDSKMVRLICDKFAYEHYDVDPKAPQISKINMILSLSNARRSRDHVLVSPFVFPIFTFDYLLRQGILATKIIRTDEGVGTYASVKHYYNAYRLELPERSIIKSLVSALIKKMAMKLTVWGGVCKASYLFDKKMNSNQQQISRIRNNLGVLGKLKDMNSKAVYVSQPHIEKNFNTNGDYVGFLNNVGKSLGFNCVLIKKHPADNFDYLSYGFDVYEGLPLEIYDVKDSVVFGFSSTALLTAKIIGGCNNVYYIKGVNGALSYDNLSDFNKRLFDIYLTQWNYKSI